MPKQKESGNGINYNLDIKNIFCKPIHNKTTLHRQKNGH